MQRRRLPPLSSLRAFEAAARNLSFTRAAEELFVTQAAISHQVKTLEAWLEVPLFRRANRQISLTDAGKAYLPPVRDALDDLHRATDRLAHTNQDHVVTVTTMPSFAVNWMVPRLRQFHDRYPEIDIRIEANEEAIDLTRGDVDLAIRYGNGYWPGLVVIKIFVEDLFPVCSPALLDGPRPLTQPSDLRFHTLLHDDMRVNWQMWLMAAGVDDIDPHRGITFNMSNLVLQAAADGQGVALGRSALVAGDLTSGRLVKPFDVKVPADWAYYLAYAPGALERPSAAAFASWLLENSDPALNDPGVLALQGSD